jgi:ferredoxin-thioredoxin reductase catalytic subunit
MPIRLNPDKEYVADIKRQLKANGGYCPCNLIKSADTKCMCKEFRESKEGMCHCGLYIKTAESTDC